MCTRETIKKNIDPFFCKIQLLNAIIELEVMIKSLNQSITFNSYL